MACPTGPTPVESLGSFDCWFWHAGNRFEKSFPPSSMPRSLCNTSLPSNSRRVVSTSKTRYGGNIPRNRSPPILPITFPGTLWDSVVETRMSQCFNFLCNKVIGAAEKEIVTGARCSCRCKMPEKGEYREAMGRLRRTGVVMIDHGISLLSHGAPRLG